MGFPMRYRWSAYIAHSSKGGSKSNFVFGHKITVLEHASCGLPSIAELLVTTMMNIVASARFINVLLLDSPFHQYCAKYLLLTKSQL